MVAACTGLSCNGIRVGFVNSHAHHDPERDRLDRRGCGHRLRVVVLASARRGAAVRHADRRRLHSVSGIHLSAGADLLASRASTTHSPASSPIHTIFGLPTMTLIFRNHFAALPEELFKAARVDGAGFWRIFGVDHAADGAADHRRCGDPAGHRHLERLHLRPGVRRPGESADDGAAQQHRQFHPGRARIQCRDGGDAADRDGAAGGVFLCPAAGSCAASPPAR